MVKDIFNIEQVVENEIAIGMPDGFHMKTQHGYIQKMPFMDLHGVPNEEWNEKSGYNDWLKAGKPGNGIEYAKPMEII
jgi:hypothetical protein